MTSLSECFNIAMDSDYVVTLTRNQDDIINNRMKLYFEKVRAAEGKFAVECKTDLDKMIMYDQQLGIKSLRLTDDGDDIDENEDN